MKRHKNPVEMLRNSRVGMLVNPVVAPTPYAREARENYADSRRNKQRSAI